jgi:3-dehydroquinate synthase
VKSELSPSTSTHRTVSFAVPFSYPVVFANGVFEAGNGALISALPALLAGRRHRLFVVLDDGLAAAQPALAGRIEAYVTANSDRLELAGPVIVVPGGERCKNDLAVLFDLQQRLASHHMDRHSFCLAVGGGAVLDVVGFAAATVHRGVRLLRVPSTVLGQNDAGVGVKNGVNAFGQKNFLGSFAPPYAVINDVALLRSLPARDLRAGMAEAVKVALIRDSAFFDWLCENAEALASFDEPALAYLIRRGAELHLDHIEGGGDPFEQGSSRPLDFGHWAAHKMEGLSHHELRHGEAVSIGIALDSLYSMASGWLPASDAGRILQLLETLGLPIDHAVLHSTSSEGRLHVAEGLDEFREHLGGELSITFLHGIGHGVTHNDVDLELVARCIARLPRLEGKVRASCGELDLSALSGAPESAHSTSVRSELA